MTNRSFKLIIAALALSAGLLGTSTVQAQRNDVLLAAATAEQPATLRTLEQLVNIETGSTDAVGLKAMADYLDGQLKSLGASVERIPSPNGAAGESVVGRMTGKGTRKILLMAHVDTVYQRGALARSPWRIDGNRAFGPGIADAKGGVAVILHTLRVLRAQGFDQFGQITILFNPDEEIGSRGSKDLITQLANASDVILSYEPTVAVRELMVLATSGAGRVDVTVKGRASHAGAAPEQGINALVEAADLVLRTQDIDDAKRGLRFSWTITQAGTVRNMIPEQATLSADVRYLRNEHFQEVLQKIQAATSKPRITGATFEVVADPGRPAFVADDAGKALIAKSQAIYKEIGFDIAVVPVTGGGTDAAYAALGGKPVLEGLGLPGFGYHSNNAEYVVIDSIPRRLYLSARLIMDLAQGR
jgi:glutamate carboxypeptidase